MIKEEKGVITVWLTLLALCMISFVLIVIELARNNQMESVCKSNLKIATISTMADYEPDIYNNYHIFLLDECYGTGKKDKNKMRDNLFKYASMSINPNYDSNSDKYMDVMDCEVNKINISNKKYMKEDNNSFINQMCSYMLKHRIESDMEERAKKYGISKEKGILCEYILEHFSSYISNYILGYMKKDYIYEVEYIIIGKAKDNDNIKELMKRLNVKDKEDIDMLEYEYKEFLYGQLSKIDITKICKRVKEIMISNINNTYDKKIREDALITSITIEGWYKLNKQTQKNNFLNKWINNKKEFGNYKIKEEFSYNESI